MRMALAMRLSYAEENRRTAMARVLRQRHAELITFNKLLQVANCSLDEAKDHPKGRFHNLTSSMVFSTFAVEAFLNHAGEMLLTDWRRHDRDRIHSKLKRVCSAVGLSVAYSQEPFATFKTMVAFRNMLAHGRTEFLSTTEEVASEAYRSDQIWSDPIGEWDTACSPEAAARFITQARALIRLIRDASPVSLPDEGDLGCIGGSEIFLTSPD